MSTGWPAVRDKCGELGISFRPWQQAAGQVILAKRRSGKYAATIGGVGLSIPRQVGKTFLVGAIIFALCLLRPGMTVIWTAHRLRTAEETFGKMRAFAKRRRIAPHVLRIVLGSGEEAVEFRNGSRILFGARERGFGLGFDEVDALIYDEAQRLSGAALDDMVPATNQSRQDTGALLLFLGTPPRPTDNGEVFKRMRREALSGEDDDTAWIEFGADPGYNPTPAPSPLNKTDWQQVAKANPSFPDDTPREAILRMRKKLGPESFLREGLGIWDPTDKPSILPNWPNLATTGSPPAPVALGVAADPDGIWLSLGAASTAPVLGYPCSLGYEPPMHLGLVLRLRVDGGQDRFVAEAKRIQDSHGGIPVAVDKKGPASFLIRPLEAAGVVLLPGGLDDWINACADLEAWIKTGGVEHGNYPELDDAVTAAGWRNVGDRRVFARKSGDISALEAACWAAWGAAQPAPESAYKSRDLMVV